MCTPGLCRRLGHTLTHEWNRAWNTHNQGGQLDDLGGEVRGGGWWCCWGRGGRGWCPEQDRKVSQDTICSLSGARCVGAHTDRSCRLTWSFLQTGARRGKERWEESFILKYNKTIKITLSSHLQHCPMYALRPDACEIRGTGAGCLVRRYQSDFRKHFALIIIVIILNVNSNQTMLTLIGTDNGQSFESKENILRLFGLWYVGH